MATLTHKRGDSLEWVFNYTENSIATDITTYTIACDVKQEDDTLIQALTVTKTDAANGVFSLTATAAQTASWPVGDHKADVEITDGSSNVFSSETFTVSLVKDITI